MLFDGATEFHARVASEAAGGTMDVHIDSLAGPLVSTLKIANTGGWQKWENASAPLAATTGEHEVYLRFKGGEGRLFNIESFHLTPAKPFAGEANAAAKVTFAMGCSVLGEKDAALFTEAVNLAREADVALVFVGADAQVSAEAQDRSSIGLPALRKNWCRPFMRRIRGRFW